MKTQQQAVAKLASLQVIHQRPTEYIGKDGISSKQITQELQEFSERLHEYALTAEGKQDSEREADREWDSREYANFPKVSKKTTYVGLWENEVSA